MWIKGDYSGHRKDRPAEEELVMDDFCSVDHGIEKLCDVAPLMAFPFGVCQL